MKTKKNKQFRFDDLSSMQKNLLVGEIVETIKKRLDENGVKNVSNALSIAGVIGIKDNVTVTYNFTTNGSDLINFLELAKKMKMTIGKVTY